MRYEREHDDCEIDVPHEHPGANARWNDDLVQFARLLCEIVATHSEIDYAGLCASMDLDYDEVDELFERAHNSWERAKREVM